MFILRIVSCFIIFYFLFLNKQNQAIFRKNDLLYFFSKENINDFQRGLQDIQKKTFILFLFLNLVKALIILIEMGLYMLLFFFKVKILCIGIRIVIQSLL